MRNGDVSFWWSDLPTPTRAPLPGGRSADVAIIGGGLTGLWTAYYLRRALPDASIALVEREFCGFGASGRNGGWLSAEVAGNRTRYHALAAARGRDGLTTNRRLTATMRAGVDEVLDRITVERIDCAAVKSGVTFVARCPAQHRRLRDMITHEKELGADDWQHLDATELNERVTIAGAVAGAHSPRCARVQPAALVHGLAEVVAASGVDIYEKTTATRIDPGTVHTDRGTVSASHILTCVEGFTPTLPGRRRSILPLNSSMIVTDPLPERVWDQIGWSRSEVLGEMAHAYTYAQRTADGRIALGGRGVPYRYGSGIDDRGRTQDATIAALTRALHDFFPAARDVPIAHSWCGVLGVTRDWSVTINYDRRSGLGSAAGYVGSGLTTTNVAARTLRDLVLGHDTDLTTLPWVDHQPRQWEPEPLRWIGTAAMYAAYRFADRRELSGTATRAHLVARVADRISGRY